MHKIYNYSNNNYCGYYYSDAAVTSKGSSFGYPLECPYNKVSNLVM